MQRRIPWLGLIAALILPPAACAAEVFELRVGYWEMIFQRPDRPTPSREFRCLTPEELEGLRFFISTDKDCAVQPGGKQTKTTYEVDTVCTTDDGSFTLHYEFKAKDSMSFAASVSVVVEGETHSATGTARWLQESCDVSGIPTV